MWNWKWQWNSQKPAKQNDCKKKYINCTIEIWFFFILGNDLDCRPWIAAQRIHCLAQRRYLLVAVWQIDGAADLFDPILMRASDWFYSHLYRAIVPCRWREMMYRANGMDDSDSFVGLWMKMRTVKFKSCDVFYICEGLPSSTKTISTIAFNGMSTVCVHMQFMPQFGGRLSPLQNCSGGMSCSCESNGDGADTYDISSISDIKWSPPGATKKRLYVFGWNTSSGR